MYICSICINETNYKPICGCEICLGCMINWFGEKNNNVPIQTFTCPNYECQHLHSLEQLIQECREQPFQEQLQEILMKQYLKNSDIRPCPNGQCNNFGYVDLKNFCDDLLECQACGMKWKDLQVSSYAYQLEIAFQNSFGSIKDFFYCFITANECPTCGVQIQRSGGCKHMTCKACNAQFCWQCKQNWNGHKATQCGSQYFVFIGLAIHFFLNLLYSIGVLHYSIFLFYPIKWLVILIFANLIPLLAVGSCYILLPFMYQVFNGRHRQRFIDYLFSLGAVALSYFTYYLIGKIHDWFDVNLWDIGKILLVELIIGLAFLCFLQRYVFYGVSLGLIALSLLYFLGFNGIGMIIWLIPYCTDFINGYMLFIASYAGLFLWNIFDLWGFITSYQFIIMVVIDVLLQRRRRHKFRILHYLFYYISLIGKRRII